MQEMIQHRYTPNKSALRPRWNQYQQSVWKKIGASIALISEGAFIFIDTENIGVDLSFCIIYFVYIIIITCQKLKQIFWKKM